MVGASRTADNVAETSVSSAHQAVDDVAPTTDDAASQQLASAISDMMQLRAQLADAESAAVAADKVPKLIDALHGSHAAIC